MGAQPSQPLLFDPIAAIKAAEAAIAQADMHAPSDWKNRALDAIEAVARRQSTFTTDDIWQELHQVHGATLAQPPEPRALGGVMRYAARSMGWIRATNATDPSDRPVCHRNPKRVWESLIYQ